MASKTEQDKLPMPPRARSVPLLSKSVSLEPLSPTLRTPRKTAVDLSRTMPTRCTSMLNASGPVFGTPYHPSPLDRIRASKKNLFFSVDLSQSMPEQKSILNCSLPEILREMEGKNNQIKEEEVEAGEGQWTGNSLHSFSFAAMPCKGSFCNIPGQDTSKLQISMSASWQFYDFVGGAATATVRPTVIRNPNKAVVTINAKTSEILVANDVACDMFAYTHDQLIGMRMSKMFTKSDEEKQEALVEQHIEDDGAVVMVSGKVLEAVDSNGVVFPVSLWMKKVTWEMEPRCIAVLEPVERQTAHFVFDHLGNILECDQQFAYLHGYSSSDDLVNVNVKELIPSLILPTPGEPMSKKVKKQQATGRTIDGPAFPLSISIRENEPKEDSGHSASYRGLVWVFTNISGLVSVSPNGDIYSCNKNFSLMLFGYSDEELVGKPITHLIPAFYDHMELVDDSSMPFPPMDEDDEVDPCSRYPYSAGETGRTFIPRDTSVIYSREIDSQASSISTDLAKDTQLKVEDEKIDLNGSTVKDILQHNDYKFTSKDLGSLPGMPGMPGSSRPSDIDSTRATLGDSSPSTISLSSLVNADDGMDENEKETGAEQTTTDNQEERQQDFEETRESGDRCGNKYALGTSEEKCGDRDEKDEVSLDGDNKDSVISSSGGHSREDRDIILDKLLESTEGPLAISSPVACSGKDQDSGVYTAEDLFRDMLVKRGKELHELRPESSSSTVESSTSGQRSTPVRSSGPRSNVLTSTPNMSSAGESPNIQSPIQPICEGMFVGRAQHKDGSSLGLLFQIKRVELKNGQVLFCTWITRDPEDEGDNVPLQGYSTLGSSHNSLFVSSVDRMRELPQSMNELNMKDDISPGRGRYNERYATLQSLGKGAFGFVKLAKRLSDDKEVVVKFIRKNKVLSGSWRDDPALGTVPFEISLLAKLKHPNIVKLMDAFENDEFFQLVMEKHGSAMDLFEFIDRQQNLDEALASYLFRQVVDAVSYLHSKNILHRDVKDENVILDETFTVKLIDFGSAAVMEEGKLFSTFCGTMEYCSPEVLLGNKYKGPELEIWSMGVTLYTLIFGENPFYDVEETIRSELHPPYAVSQDLMFLICWMLHPDHHFRAIMQDLHENRWLKQPVDIELYSFTSIVGVTEDLKEILDEEVDYNEPLHDDPTSANGATDHKNRCLQAEYQLYLESVVNEEDEKQL